MSGPVKYLFGESFDEEEIDEKEILATELRALLRRDFDEELENARKRAYEEGFQAGQESAKEDNEVALRKSNEEMSVKLERLNGFMEELFSRYEKLQRSFNTRAMEFRDQAVAVGVKAAEVVARELVQERPVALLEEAFRNVMKHIGEDVRVSISISEDLIEEARQRVSELAELHGFEGKLIFIPEQGLPAGDWRVEWGDGGILKSLNDIQDQINREVSRYLVGVEVSLEEEAGESEEPEGFAEGETGENNGPGDDG